MTAGTARGIRNNNPGNIRKVSGTRWQGQSTDQSGDKEFVVFTEPKWGIRAICRTLITYQDKRQAADGSKIDSISEIIARWAPASENNTAAYAEHVANITHIGIMSYIDVYQWDTMKALVKAIIQHENGSMPYDDNTINSGLIASGLQIPKQPDKTDNIAAATAVVVAAGQAVTTISGSSKDVITSISSMLIGTGLPPHIINSVVSIAVFAAVAYLIYRMVILKYLIKS